MKTLLGILSLLCFAATLMMVLVFATDTSKLYYVLVLAILIGLTIVFRGLRARLN